MLANIERVLKKLCVCPPKCIAGQVNEKGKKQSEGLSSSSYCCKVSDLKNGG